MDWTKIKTKHFLFSNLRKSLKGSLVDLLCLTAHLETMPTEKQMLRVCRKPALKLLQSYFKVESTSLQLVLQKVLEDVEKTKHKRDVSRKTSNTYRKKHNLSDASNDAIEKIREDKIREDSSTKTSPKKKKLTDEEWLLAVKNNPAYKHIDIDTELNKMDAWLSTRAGRKKTRRFIINWLNKIEKGVIIQPQQKKRIGTTAEELRKQFEEER